MSVPSLGDVTVCFGISPPLMDHRRHLVSNQAWKVYRTFQSQEQKVFPEGKITESKRDTYWHRQGFLGPEGMVSGTESCIRK